MQRLPFIQIFLKNLNLGEIFREILAVSNPAQFREREKTPVSGGFRAGL